MPSATGAPTPVTSSPVPPAQLHDTLVPADVNIRTGTFASGTLSQYSAPFDDFTSTATTTIRSVEWQGFYCNTGFTGNAIPDPVATAFIFRLAPNDGTADRPSFDAFGPAASTPAIQLTTIAASAVRQQLEFTRPDAACGARVQGDPAAYYRFSADLPSPYSVTAGGRYWLSIYAVMPAGQVSWSWRFGRQDNSFSIFWLNGTLTTFFGDRAFSLT